MNEVDRPTVSVIVPIYNGEFDLPTLLDSLLAQTYPKTQVEYLLVDNGSSDRTPDLLQAAVETSVAQGIRLRQLVASHIQSSYAARNVGIHAAAGDILAFTDVDCRPSPNWLHMLIQPFQNARVGIVAGEVLALPGKTILEKFADRQRILSQTHTLSHPFLPYGQTANLAIRRQAVVQAGLFRPYLTTGGDADLCWRLQHQGWQIHFAPEAIVQHRHRSTLSALQQQWQRYGRSNRYLHDLYGVALMPNLTVKGYFYRWTRWLLKEVPLTGLNLLARRAEIADLFYTPLDLLCRQARARGQQNAPLSKSAEAIEHLSQSPPRPPTAILDG